MVQDAVFGDPHTRPEHPELEAAAIAVITTFQVCPHLCVLPVIHMLTFPDWSHYQCSGLT